MRRHRRSWPADRGATITLLAVLLACTPSARTGSRDLLPETDVPPARIVPRTGSPIASPAGPTRSAKAGPPMGAMSIFVSDDQQRLRSDVRIEFRGPQRGAVSTGEDGSARVRVPVGTYRLRIPQGCQPALEVTEERIHPEVIVYEDRVSTVRFSELEARRRFWPSIPVQWTIDPPWQAGEPVTLTFLILDRCTGDASAAGTSFGTLRYAPNRFVRVIGSPVKQTAAEGRATVTFSCTGAGKGALHVVDPETGERVDLLTMRQPFAPIDELCS